VKRIFSEKMAVCLDDRFRSSAKEATQAAVQKAVGRPGVLFMRSCHGVHQSGQFNSATQVIHSLGMHFLGTGSERRRGTQTKEICSAMPLWRGAEAKN
jgi:hypothetical protein